ncbi:5069_t:CDS:1, partial [Scutellospora calospora]
KPLNKKEMYTLQPNIQNISSLNIKKDNFLDSIKLSQPIVKPLTVPQTQNTSSLLNISNICNSNPSRDRLFDSNQIQPQQQNQQSWINHNNWSIDP